MSIFLLYNCSSESRGRTRSSAQHHARRLVEAAQCYPFQHAGPRLVQRQWGNLKRAIFRCYRWKYGHGHAAYSFVVSSCRHNRPWQSPWLLLLGQLAWNLLRWFELITIINKVKGFGRMGFHFLFDLCFVWVSMGFFSFLFLSFFIVIVSSILLNLKTWQNHKWSFIENIYILYIIYYIYVYLYRHVYIYIYILMILDRILPLITITKRTKLSMHAISRRIAHCCTAHEILSEIQLTILNLAWVCNLC